MIGSHTDQGANAADLLSAEGAANARWHAIGGNGDVRSMSAQEVREAALAVAPSIARRLAVEPDDATSRTVVLALSDPLEFVVAFFGVQLAGGTPAPAPGMLDSHPVHLRRVLGMVKASGAKLVMTAASRAALVRRHLGASSATVLSLRDIEDDAHQGTALERPPMWGSAEWPAYVQYTSGSTADPSPVVVRCRHVIAQLQQAAAVYEEHSGSVSVAWVPLHHDMGLVTSVLRPLWSGYTSVLLQPLDFVRRPRHWVEQMTRWAATHTSAPNFGYALCAAKVGDVSGLDLEPLRVARVAGELVRAHSLREFAERFAPAGFKRAAFAPSYGMAEATLTVTTCRPGEPPREVVVSASGIRRGRVESAASADDELVLLSCGAPLPHTSVRILSEPSLPRSSVDDGEGSHTGPDEAAVGEVWIGGPQVVAGGKDDELDGCPGRRTGDIGFMSAGELVLLGRATERFQFHGSNYYCAELEDSVVRACPEVRPGRVAVFAASEEEGAGEPQVVVLAELRAAQGAHSAARLHAQSEHVRSALRREHGLPIHRVCWLRAHTLPVTTSGKLRRLECRELYQRDDLEVLRGEDDDVDVTKHAAGMRP